MTTIIKIKRGLEKNLPKLEIGELVYTTDTKKLHVGVEEGSEPFESVSSLLPISAEDISETTQKQFVDGAMISQIQSNASDLSSVLSRLSEVEQISFSSDSNGLVKLHDEDLLGYLSEKIDDFTIRLMEGKLSVHHLIGLMATIDELNSLIGINGNIQAQLDNMLKVINPQEIYPTEQELPLLPNDLFLKGSTVLVQTDSNYDGSTTFYMSTGTEWEYVNRINSDIIRDFLLNPININTETHGLLEKSRYEKQNALETPFVDATGTLQARNTNDAILEVLRVADSAKSLLSDAIGVPALKTQSFMEIASVISSTKELLISYLIEKGVGVSEFNTLPELINKVPSISSVEISAGIERVSKLEIIAPHTHRITLKEQLSPRDITVSLIEFMPGDQDVLYHSIVFDDSDAGYFLSNKDISFDGTLKIDHSLTDSMHTNDSLLETKKTYRYTVNKNLFNSINNIEIIPFGGYTDNLVPNMTNYTAPEGKVEYGGSLLYWSGSTYHAHFLFSRSDNGAFSSADRSPIWVSYEFVSPKKIEKYTLSTHDWLYERSPKNWTFEAWDGTAWTVLHSVVNAPYWSSTAPREYAFSNNNYYSKYRIYITANHGGPQIHLNQLQMMERISNKVLINVDGIMLGYNDGWTEELDPENGFDISLLDRVDGVSPIDDLPEIFEVIGLVNDNYPRKIRIEGNKKITDPFVCPVKDIFLVGIESIRVYLSATGSGRISPSIDNGMTWITYDNGWRMIKDPSEGMSFNDFNALTPKALKELLSLSNTLRFGYYLTEDTVIDELTLHANMLGTEKLANPSDYKIDYNYSDQTIIIDFAKSGIYTINYIDG